MEEFTIVHFHVLSGNLVIIIGFKSLDYLSLAAHLLFCGHEGGDSFQLNPDADA